MKCPVCGAEFVRGNIYECGKHVKECKKKKRNVFLQRKRVNGRFVPNVRNEDPDTSEPSTSRQSANEEMIPDLQDDTDAPANDDNVHSPDVRNEPSTSRQSANLVWPDSDETSDGDELSKLMLSSTNRTLRSHNMIRRLARRFQLNKNRKAVQVKLEPGQELDQIRFIYRNPDEIPIRETPPAARIEIKEEPSDQE